MEQKEPENQASDCGLITGSNYNKRYTRVSISQAGIDLLSLPDARKKIIPQGKSKHSVEYLEGNDIDRRGLEKNRRKSWVRAEGDWWLKKEDKVSHEE